MDLLKKYFLRPGYLFVSREPYLIYTVLGSCISICLWDNKRQMGGMNHYIYGKTGSQKPSGKYGDAAIPHLIRMLTDLGSDPQNLKAHVVGGAQSLQLQSAVGRNNVAIAEDLLAKYRIEILTLEIGGHIGRKIIFNTHNGELLIYKVNKIRESDWYNGK